VVFGPRRPRLISVRVLLALVLIVGVVGLVLPYQTGVQAQRSLENATLWRVAAAERNWFDSRHQLEIPVTGSDYPLLIELQLRHGPLWRDGHWHWATGEVRVPPDAAVMLQSWQDEQPWYLRVAVSIGGQLRLTPELDGATSSFGDLRYSLTRNQLKGVLSLPGIRVVSPSQSLLFGRTHLDLDARDRGVDGWEGELGLSVSRLGVIHDNRGWLADGFSLRGRRDHQPGGERLQLSATLDSFTRDGETVGPFALLMLSDDLTPGFWSLVGKAAEQGRRLRDEGWPGLLIGQRLKQDWQAPLLQGLQQARLRLDSLQLNFSEGGLHLVGEMLGPGHARAREVAGGDWLVAGQGRVSPVVLESALADWLAALRPDEAEQLSPLMVRRLERLGWILADQGDWIASINRIEGEWWLNGQLVDPADLSPTF